MSDTNQAFHAGVALVGNHPLFESLARRARFYRASPTDVYPDGSPAPPKDGWAVVDAAGNIIGNPSRRGTSDEWAYVFAHCLLHLAFNHHIGPVHKKEWQVASCAIVARFLRNLKFGHRPENVNDEIDLSNSSEQAFYRQFIEQGVPDHLLHLSMAGRIGLDLVQVTKRSNWYGEDWQSHFAKGLVKAVHETVRHAGATTRDSGSLDVPLTKAERIKRWFVNSYPLIGALAAAFKLIENPSVCNNERIPIAAVNPELRELYINPAAQLTEEELKFVMAHEFMHVGLRHDTRCQGRDPYLWNVACDYVINGWLIEMGVGVLPAGSLFDLALKGMSAEGVYDCITTDLRRARKLSTLRGNCDQQGDVICGSKRSWWEVGKGISLDEFYRRCLSEGLTYHQEHDRGFLPAGLIEEINALSQPAIPWDVQLAKWFDEHFPPLERIRTYARLSRRQSSTPSIARPSYVPPADRDQRTFAVILDTSGSMDRTLLAKALGAIASYSIARDVTAVRVVFCDAAPYDQGYLAPSDIASSVKVRGKGGTILQPAIDLLESAIDFPKDGPFLIITDGYCDVLRIRRQHAFLLPASRTLPFNSHGEIFRIK